MTGVRPCLPPATASPVATAAWRYLERCRVAGDDRTARELLDEILGDPGLVTLLIRELGEAA